MRWTITNLRVTRRRALVATVALVLVAGGVDAAVAYYGDRANPDAGPELVWPAAPDAPRIKYVRSVTSPEDLKLKKTSLFKKIVKKIVGLEDGDSKLAAPYGMTTDSRGRLIVTDPKGAAVHVFDTAGKK